jgi:hypothetical protein
LRHGCGQAHRNRSRDQQQGRQTRETSAIHSEISIGRPIGSFP